MGRDLRFIPPNSLVEVTCRTLHGRFLLRPHRDLNPIILGVLARAQQHYGMTVCAFVYLSNHCHLLLQPEDAWQLARFMNYVNSNIAKEAGRLYNWREKFWGRRYRAIVVSNEPEAEEKRLRYLYSQGCKEGLVDSPRRWPGATSAKAKDGRLRGLWFHRSAEYKARKRGEVVGKMTFAEEVELELTPIPSWQALRQHQSDSKLRALLREIALETREALRENGDKPMGAKAILRQSPRGRPRRSESSPAPRFHAHLGCVRRRLEYAYVRFYYSYREAARRARDGLEAQFPAGAFLPSSLFLPHPA